LPQHHPHAAIRPKPTGAGSAEDTPVGPPRPLGILNPIPWLSSQSAARLSATLGACREQKGCGDTHASEETPMTAKFDPNDWNTALVQLKSEHASPPDSSPSDATSIREREAFKVKVIESRVKLKLMRDRTDALKEALERFRSRQDAMRA